MVHNEQVGSELDAQTLSSSILSPLQPAALKYVIQASVSSLTHCQMILMGRGERPKPRDPYMCPTKSDKMFFGYYRTLEEQQTIVLVGLTIPETAPFISHLAASVCHNTWINVQPISKAVCERFYATYVGLSCSPGFSSTPGGVNCTNSRLRQGEGLHIARVNGFLWDDYTVEVRLNDYLDIVCPHYEEGSAPSHTVERYTLFLVEYEEYSTCKPISKDQVRWECNKPFAPHGPEKFSEKFQRFTPFTLGKEFKEGGTYYYISKPIHHHGESCMKLKVHVAGKATQPPSTNVHTPKARIQSGKKNSLAVKLGHTGPRERNRIPSPALDTGRSSETL
ncbi:Elfa-A-prov [Pelobates cultripes]|uniref:Ephrin-A1 n=1 Tax=Pelobates cultripes TaxID=61616 RepID=A0AAD1TM08_PELCU|nr:Elfa-A-prov [Pelobates cultripes]